MKKLENFFSYLITLTNSPDFGLAKYLGINYDLSRHYYRVPVLALLLGLEAGLSKDELFDVLIAAIFHDFEEGFLGDIDFISVQFLEKENKNKAKEKVLELLFEKMPEKLAGLVREAISRVEADEKLKAIVKDADKLDYVLQAKQLKALGIEDARIWGKNAKLFMKTEIAKKFAEIIEKQDINCFWKEMQSPERLKSLVRFSNKEHI